MNPLIETALGHSPAHSKVLRQAIAAIPDERLDLIAYTLGRACTVEGVTDFPNPFAVQTEERQLWAGWFEVGRSGSGDAPMALEDQRLTQMRGQLANLQLGLEESSRALASAGDHIKDQATAIESLTKQRDAANTVIDTIHAANAELVVERDALQARVTELEAQIAAAPAKNTDTAADTKTVAA
jgi:hypothetical protein